MAAVSPAVPIALLIAVLVGTPAAPAAMPPPPVDPVVCATNLVISGQAVQDPGSLLGCGFTGSQGFTAIYSSGTQGGAILDPDTRVVGALPTWSCTSGATPVASGDDLPDANPSVTCQPPSGASPLDCQSVELEFLPLHTTPASTWASTGTAACGALAATAAWPDRYAGTTGSAAFPFTCSVDNSAASAEGFLVLCDVNL